MGTLRENSFRFPRLKYVQLFSDNWNINQRDHKLVAAQRAVHSVLLGSELRTADYWRERIPPNIAIVRKTFRDCGDGMAFLSPHGFYFRIWWRGERLARAQRDGVRVSAICMICTCCCSWHFMVMLLWLRWRSEHCIHDHFENPVWYEHVCKY